MLVWTKADRARSTPPADCVATSSLAGTGLDELRQRLRALLLDAPATNVDLVPATAARARGSLDQACEAVHRAQQIALDDRGNELIAAELRLALEALGEIVGTVYTDDILDRIFSRFCIGK